MLSVRSFTWQLTPSDLGQINAYISINTKQNRSVFSLDNVNNDCHLYAKNKYLPTWHVNLRKSGKASA